MAIKWATLLLYRHLGAISIIDRHRGAISIIDRYLDAISIIDRYLDAISIIGRYLGAISIIDRHLGAISIVTGVFDFGISLEAHTPTKTLGGVLRCDPEVMKPSAKTPDDVNQVRPADINVIAAMGDSITASFMFSLVASLSRNYHDDPYLLYPGNSYVTGGDETLEKHISVTSECPPNNYITIKESYTTSGAT
uniref:ANF_receptor domain-containing protein n=1 Tax=Angiostrongylus cantonensis TaxID=6313 RepID=A0A0K0DEI3_ANGCA